jgi:hypothetical protein
MRCLCYAKFLSNGTIPLSEFFAHLGTEWSCIEETPGTLKTSNLDVVRNQLLPKSIVFIADCMSIEQLTSDLATLPGACISRLEIFPVPEVLEYQ